jgi:hypothetical protein
MAEYENKNVAVVDEQCPLHGDNAVGNCWPCHVAGVQASPDDASEADE